MRRVLLGLWLLLVLVIIYELFFAHYIHPVFWWHRIPGFFSLYFLISALVVIILSKLLGRYWLQKDEDYYDGD